MNIRRKLTNLRISTKLLLLNVIICLAFLLLAAGMLTSLAIVGNLSTGLIDRDIGRSLENSQTARELSRVFAAINILEHSFYGRDDILTEEGTRLTGRVESLLARTGHPQLRQGLRAFASALQAYLARCKTINGIISDRERYEGESLAAVTALEGMLADPATMKKGVQLASDCRQRLVEIGKLAAYQEERYRRELPPDTEVQAVLNSSFNEFEGRLAAIRSAFPAVAGQVGETALSLGFYRDSVLSFCEEMNGLHALRVEMRKAEAVSLAAMEAIDENISLTVNRVSDSLAKIILFSATIFLIIILVITVAFFFTAVSLAKKNINQPMQRILAGIDDFRRGDFRGGIKLNRVDEWDSIEKALNNMATELLRSNKDLQESRQRFYELAELLPQPVFEIDPRGAFTYVNRCGLETFGYDAGFDPQGINAMDVYLPEDRERVRENIRKKLTGDPFDDHEYTCLRKDGSTFPVLIYSAPILKNGQPVGVRGIVVDISERKRAEEELRRAHAELERRVEERTAQLSETNRRLIQAHQALQEAHDKLEQRVRERTAELQQTHEQLLHAEKLSAVGQLSSSIAHEFNNPLQGIMFVINRIKKKVAGQEEQELVAMALKECKRMKNLIKDLQDFNRPSSGIMAAMDLHAALDGLLLLSKKDYENRGIRVVRHYGGDVPAIKAVADQIKQVLLNVLKNAVDACAGGGIITITTRLDGRQVEIAIADNGTGIDPQHIEHIFEPFFTTKSAVSGIGLGLSVSYGIIKKHNGRIEVDSTPGHGTTFTIILPV